MATTKWDDLLPTSGGPGLSGNEMLHQLMGAALGGSGSASSVDAGASIVSQSSLVPGPTRDFTEEMSSLTAQLGGLASAQQTQLSATQENTQALQQNTVSKSGGASVADTLGTVTSSLLGSGSILSPIVSGFMNLFSSKDGDVKAENAPFMLPAPVRYDGGLAGGSPGQVLPVSYGDAGQPRAQTTTSPTQVTVQVNAMDSQSFLDHRDEIAQAVRQALLSSNSLSDVILEL